MKEKCLRLVSMLKRVGDDMAAFLFQTSVKMKLCPSVNGLITTQVADSRHNICLPPNFARMCERTMMTSELLQG